MSNVLRCIFATAVMAGFVALSIRSAEPTIAAAGTTAATADADQAWSEAKAAINSSPGDLKDKSKEEVALLVEKRQRRIHETNLFFFEHFPADDRHWDALLQLRIYTPRFLTGFSADGLPLIDRDATALWQARLLSMEAAALRAPDLPERVVERFEARPIFDAIGATFHALEEHTPVDWKSLRARVDAHLAKFSKEPAIAGVVSRYLAMFERDHTAQESAAEWRALTRNPVVRESESIKKRLEVIERETSKPMEMAFTAVDGREVDLAKLRGKVVLIDFWATWCGPCIAELPNVKRVYDAYHNKGFEVIGISLEDAGLVTEETIASGQVHDRTAKLDTPQQIAAKHATAKEKLAKFIRAHELPWPQHYDGKYWDNDIAKKRFNINAVPATFLIDKSGMVAVVGVRGPQLETEVKRLLAQ